MRETRPVPSFGLRSAAPAIPLAAQAVPCVLGGLALMQLCRVAGLSGDATGWWAASALYLSGSALVVGLMRRFYPHDRLGGGNAVTFLRGALVAALAAPLLAGDAAGVAIAATGAVALALDGVDGWLARRSGLTSGFGGRFDMEVDAALALILSLHVLVGTGIGPEILLLGLTRYAFVAAGLIWQVLTAPLPPRFRRKLICVLQLAALIVLQLPMPSPEAAIWLARAATAALLWSFAVDILWLWRRRG